MENDIKIRLFVCGKIEIIMFLILFIIIKIAINQYKYHLKINKNDLDVITFLVSFF